MTRLLLLSLAFLATFLLHSYPATGFRALTTPAKSQAKKHQKFHPATLFTSRLHKKQMSLIRESATTNENESNIAVGSSASKTEKRILLVWFHAVVGFVIWNYYTSSTLWPSFFLSVPLRVWNLLHALSAMLFAGGIVTTTVLEWKLPSVGSDAEQTILLKWLWQVESKLVLPAVSMSLVSGVVQAHVNYASLRAAPPHVKGALHVMALFAIWWAWTDRRSQASLREGGYDETKVTQRRVSNLVSCGFLVALYSMMILKPGF